MVERRPWWEREEQARRDVCWMLDILQAAAAG